MNITEYKEMFAKVQAGQISERVWFDYCFQTLSEIMEDNKDIFIRLKTRGWAKHLLKLLWASGTH